MIYVVLYNGTLVGAWHSFSAAREHADKCPYDTAIQAMSGTTVCGRAERSPYTREWETRWGTL